MAAKNMISGAHAQIEIIQSECNTPDGDGILALATFYWDPHMCWGDFSKKVLDIADRMYAEFDEEFDGVTEYVQFRTGYLTEGETNNEKG